VDRGRRYGYPLSVIMCDIDHFKHINDDRGHASGDEVLHQFAHRIGGSIRSASDWIARYGGEEFMLVLPETDLKGGSVVAEKIRGIIASKPFVSRCGDLAVTASFGVAATAAGGPDLTVQVDALLKAADQCLYASKAAGRNCTRGMEVSRVPVPAGH
jgi:diguanylate cyclase (GGDEF)-like protein